MGILNPVQRLFIARPDDAKDQIVYKWPDQNIRMLTQLTVQQDELAVFFQDGKIVGTLGPGRHQLDGKAIPFLGELVDLATGGNILISELYFVSNRPFTNFPFGGSVDMVEDSNTNLIVQVRVFGEYSMKVSSPENLILNLVGTQNLETNDAIGEWIKSQILKITRMHISKKIKDKAWDILAIATHNSELETELTPLVNKEIASYGIALERFGNITISLKDEDAQMLKNLRRDQIYAKTPGAADAAMKVGIGQGMEKGNTAGNTGVGMGVGIAVGADLLKDKKS